MFVAGHEPGDGEAGWELEVAWIEQRVAITRDADDERDDWLEHAGWTSKPASAWTLETLLAAIRGTI